MRWYLYTLKTMRNLVGELREKNTGFLLYLIRLRFGH